jgi:hypothetical protein
MGSEQEDRLDIRVSGQYGLQAASDFVDGHGHEIRLLSGLYTPFQTRGVRQVHGPQPAMNYSMHGGIQRQIDHNLP